ncbi:MAG: hypothetical protein WCE21_03335 [Candidatus Babeliales bacterium]
MNRTVRIFVLLVTCVLSCDLQAMLSRGTGKIMNIKPSVITRGFNKSYVPTGCPVPAIKNAPIQSRTFKTEKEEGGRGWEEKTSRGSEFFEKYKGGIGLGVAATTIGGAYYLSGKEQREVIAQEWKSLEGTAQKFRELARNAAPNSSEALLYEFAYLNAQGKISSATDKLIAVIEKIKEEERQVRRDEESAQRRSLFARLSAYGTSFFTYSPQQRAINIINTNHLFSLAVQTACLNHLQSVASGKQIAKDVAITIGESFRGSVAQAIEGPLVQTDSLPYIVKLFQVVDNKKQLKDIAALESLDPGFWKRIDEFWINPSIESYNTIARAIAKQMR